MGPAGRVEAIHFPSATLKAASREGGVVVGVGGGRKRRGGQKNEIEEKRPGRDVEGVFIILRRVEQGAIAVGQNRTRPTARAEK